MVTNIFNGSQKKHKIIEFYRGENQKMTEKNIESYLRKKVSLKKGLALKLIPAGLAGLPDRLVLMPGGLLFFAELKAPRK